jgi:hypothetical protein
VSMSGITPKPADSLAALLSQTLVAFTIEFDNEFEHRSPHATSNFGISPLGRGPWLTSMAMWLNCMRYVDDSGISVKDLERAARTHTIVRGMQRWGYIAISPEKILLPTLKGAIAREIWKPLTAEIEERWRTRFAIDPVREALRKIDTKLPPSLPDCMPILGYGLVSRVGNYPAPPRRDTSFPAMLAHLLVSFAIEFESKSPISLAICANVLRVLDEDGVRVADIPGLAGVSKESVAMAMGILTRHKLVTLGKTGSSKIATLTAAGIVAQEAYRKLIATIEKPFGSELSDALRQIQPRLFEAIEPYPEGWRAKVRKPSTLPHFPMVLHRGGYPDGA